MSKPITTKPSDRGTDNPEPGATPGTRSAQRSTSAQLEDAPASDDPAIAWERDEQENLPPRGAGSQHNQGAEKEPTVAEVGQDATDQDMAPADTDDDGLQLGGTRGPSNEANNGSGR